MSDGGKGSKPRPYSVTQAEYESRWDAIFGRDKFSEITEKANRERALDKMVRVNQELGLYDESSNSNTDNRN
jgi:hypothetical protein